MIGQVALRRETFIAVVNVAHEGLFARMDALVRLQVALFGELFAAVRKRTLEGFLAALELARVT